MVETHLHLFTLHINLLLLVHSARLTTTTTAPPLPSISLLFYDLELANGDAYNNLSIHNNQSLYSYIVFTITAPIVEYEYKKTPPWCICPFLHLSLDD